jgi:hypothetical protein
VAHLVHYKGRPRGLFLSCTGGQCLLFTGGLGHTSCDVKEDWGTSFAMLRWTRAHFL